MPFFPILSGYLPYWVYTTGLSALFPISIRAIWSVKFGYLLYCLLLGPTFPTSPYSFRRSTLYLSQSRVHGGFDFLFVNKMSLCKNI